MALKNDSGIGLKLSDMNEVQFKGHRERVLARMTLKGASKEAVIEARKRINNRRESSAEPQKFITCQEAEA